MNNNHCIIKKCKKNEFIKIKNNSYCKNHCLLNYNNYVIKIQKLFLGYKCRKKLKNIYYNLPNDLQKYILFFLNKTIYQEKYNKTLRNILYKKSSCIIYNFYNKTNIPLMLIKNIYYLNNKYRNIMLLNDMKCLYVYGEEIISSLYNYITYYYFDNNNITIESNDFIIDYNNTNLNNIIETIQTINNFLCNYNLELNIVKKLNIINQVI